MGLGDMFSFNMERMCVFKECSLWGRSGESGESCRERLRLKMESIDLKRYI